MQPWRQAYGSQRLVSPLQPNVSELPLREVCELLHPPSGRQQTLRVEGEVKLPYGQPYPKWLRDHIDAVMRLMEQWKKADLQAR